MLIGRAGAAIGCAGAVILVVSAAIDGGGAAVGCGRVVIEYGREHARLGGAQGRGDRTAIIRASSRADGGWEFFRFGGSRTQFGRERIRR